MWFTKKKTAQATPPKLSPLIDPESRLPLEERDTPGYYPGFSVISQQKFWDAATRKLVLDRISNVPAIQFFTPEEAATMQAVVSRVLPQEDRTGATRIPVLPGIDKRLFLNHIEGYRFEDMPSDQEAYRIAAKAIERMAQELHGEPFPTLKVIEQEEILKSLHDAAPLAAKEAWRGVNIERFWTMLVSDCCAVYYAHPSAWDEIGFGGPAYPRGYMRLEGGEPEPWEVDEQRYDWLAPIDTLSDFEPSQAKPHAQTRKGK